MIKEWIRDHISNYTDSKGEIGFEIIEDLQEEFGLSPKRAEQYLTEYMEENGLE